VYSQRDSNPYLLFVQIYDRLQIEFILLMVVTIFFRRIVVMQSRNGTLKYAIPGHVVHLREITLPDIVEAVTNATTAVCKN